MPTSRLRRPSRTLASSPLTADARPLLSPDVVFEVAAESGTSIALVHGLPSSRVSPAALELLVAMDGKSTLGDLHRRFAPDAPAEDFLGLVQRFRSCGLLDGDQRRAPGRVSFRPPFTLQLATMHAPGVFRVLDSLMLWMPPRAALGGLVALLGAGALAAVVQAGDLRFVLAAPVPLGELVGLVAALLLLTLLHEGAHGLTLTRFGGIPRRAGVMLFYLTPAFFVDVTDGWRLPDRRQRVAIALAGPALHCAAGAVALLVALAVAPSPADRFLLLLALSCATVVLVNLVPFVRFDGYIALMSALDEPNLRSRAMHDAAEWLARVLFGAVRSAPRLDRRWSVAFGVASLVTPIVLVVFAVSRISSALAVGGPVLDLLVVALEATVAVVGAVIVMRALRGVLRSGVSRPRFFAVCALLLAGIGGGGAIVSVPASATFGYVVRDDRVLLVQADAPGAAPPPRGAQVDLLSAGILLGGQVGEGAVRPRSSQSTTVPLDALFPVSAEGAEVEAYIVAEVRVREGAEGVPETGRARVALGAHSLWLALWDAAVTTPLPMLQSEK